jgi:hypothetical protein
MAGSGARFVRNNVVGLIALFVALGGTAFAVGLAKNSVKSKQIKAGAVKTAELADGAVTSPKVEDGSLLGKDFGAGQLPAGPQGPTGQTGPKGDAGVPGPITGVLPSGVTERGTFVVRDASGDEVLIDYPISFGLTLPSSVAASYRPSTSVATPECPGSAASPTAAPGNLCVYEAVQLKRAATFGIPGFVDPVTTANTSSARPYGVIFRASRAAAETGDWYIYGTWAVTAP